VDFGQSVEPGSGLDENGRSQEHSTMKIYQVLGSVTLNRCHPSYIGARLVATRPLDAELLGGQASPDADLVVVWDDLGAGEGATIAVSDGAEAAQPFRPELKAVDAYCSAILDTIYIDPTVLKQLNIP
jgi:microcompartment protein CcmK/EutM